MIFFLTLKKKASECRNCSSNRNKQKNDDIERITEKKRVKTVSICLQQKPQKMKVMTIKMDPNMRREYLLNPDSFANEEKK